MIDLERVPPIRGFELTRRRWFAAIAGALGLPAAAKASAPEGVTKRPRVLYPALSSKLYNLPLESEVWINDELYVVVSRNAHGIVLLERARSRAEIW